MSRQTIDLEATYIAFFDRFELVLPGRCVVDCSTSGDVDVPVGYWPEKITRPATCTPERLVEELNEYGCWETDEMGDDAANWRRIVWLGTCQVAEDTEDERILFVS